MILRWFVPFVLGLLLSMLFVGVWLHNWRAIIGALVAVVCICFVEVES